MNPQAEPPSAGSPRHPQPRPPRGDRLARLGWPATLLIGASALTVAATVLWRVTSPPPRPEPKVVAVRADAAALGAPTIEVAVRTAPAEAELRFDGDPVDNPYRALVAREDRAIVVEATLDGYEAASRVLPLTRPHDIELVLTPKAADEPPDAAKER